MYDDSTGTDRRISALFHSSTAQIEPDVPALVRGGIDRGRDRQRRRTVGAGFVAAAAVGVVGMATTVAPGFDLRGPDAGPAGSPVSVTTPTASAVARPTATQPKTKPTPRPIPLANIPVKAADLPGLFTDLYPGKVTPADARTGRIIDDGKAGQYAHFRWNGFMTTVGFTAYTGTPAQRCREVQQDASQSNEPAVTCVTRPDGTVLIRGRSVVADHDGGGVSVNNHAFLFTEDGYEIFVISYNWAGKTEPVLAKEPPFSIAQLTRAVTSDWSS
jgi:hypothetical protein